MTMKTVGCKPENIPDILKLEGRFCVWRAHLKKGRKGWDKVPLDGRRGLSTAKPEQWLTFDEAVALYDTGKFEGIGVLCEPGFVYVDLDKCVHDGEIEPWAQEIVDQLHTYTEFSPSGTGVRMLAEGTAPRDLAWSEGTQTELYVGQSARFVTLTGVTLNGDMTEFTQEKRAWYFDKYGGPDTGPVPKEPVPGYPPPEELPEVSPEEVERVLMAEDRSRAVTAFLKSHDYTDEDALGICMEHFFDIGEAHRPNRGRGHIELYFWKHHVLTSRETRASKRADFEVIEADVPGLPAEPSRVTAPELPAEIMEGFTEPMRAAYDYVLSTAKFPVPMYAFASVMGALSGVSSRWMRNMENLAPHLYLMTVGPSGSGKNAGYSGVRDLLTAAGKEGIVRGRPASGPGMLDALEDAGGQAMFAMDEIGTILQGFKASDHGVTSVLLDLFTAHNIAKYNNRSMSRVRGTTIPYPYTCVVGATTMTALAAGLNMEDAEKGLLNRFLFFINDGGPRRPDPVEVNPDEDALWRWEGWALDYLTHHHLTGEDKPYKIPWTSPVSKELHLDMQKTMNDFHNNAPTQKEAMLRARMIEYVPKLAILRAITRGTAHPGIATEDTEWAYGVVCWLVDRTVSVLGPQIVRSDHEREVNSMVDMVRRAKTLKRSRYKEYLDRGICPKGVLHENFHHLPRRDFESVYTTMLEMSTFREATVRTGQRGPGAAVVFNAAEKYTVEYVNNHRVKG